MQTAWRMQRQMKAESRVLEAYLRIAPPRDVTPAAASVTRGAVSKALWGQEEPAGGQRATDVAYATATLLRSAGCNPTPYLRHLGALEAAEAWGGDAALLGRRLALENRGARLARLRALAGAGEPRRFYAELHAVAACAGPDALRRERRARRTLAGLAAGTLLLLLCLFARWLAWAK